MADTSFTEWLETGAPGTAVVDGRVYDLDRTLIDALGTEWRWIGRRDGDGQPLMQSAPRPRWGCGPVPLADVYEWYGPFLVAPEPDAAGEVA